MSAGATSQNNVLTDYREGMPGVLLYPTSVGTRDWLINTDPQAKEVWTLVIDTGTDSEAYGVNLTSPATESVSFTAGVGTTPTLIAEGLVTAWNTTPGARGFAKATNVAGTVTFTGEVAGIAFGLAEDENAAKMTLTNSTSALQADPIPFGRAVVSLTAEAGQHDRFGILAKTTAVDARISSLAITQAAGEVYTVELVVEGVSYSVDVDEDTDDDTTATAIRLAINNMLPANTVIAAGATNNVTLTAEVPGKYFEVSLGLKSGTTARMVLTDTTNTPACDLNRAFAGVALRTTQVQATQVGVDAAEWPPNYGVEALSRMGFVWVESSETPAYRDDVYVELAAGSNAGRFYAASSATRVRLDPRIARWDIRSASDSDADVNALQLL